MMKPYPIRWTAWLLALVGLSCRLGESPGDFAEGTEPLDASSKDGAFVGNAGAVRRPVRC